MAEIFEDWIELRRQGTSSASVRMTSGGALVLGGPTTDGDFYIKNHEDQVRFRFYGDTGELQIRTDSGDPVAVLRANGTLQLGGGGFDGDIDLRRSDGRRSIRMDADNANLYLGGNGGDGDIVLFPPTVDHSNDVADSSIHLNGSTGDIILRNADAAEDFDVVDDSVEPGTVLCIDDHGRLRPSNRPYDRRVAGVVSGAGCYDPGLVLDRQPDRTGRAPVALAGKVIVNVDAERHPVEIGDLLTTSSRTGHAMPVADSQRAFGAVIGKALGSLDGGVGQVPILVALQ